MSAPERRAGEWVLGLDLGTGSLKGLLLDRSGRVGAQAARDYPTRIPAAGWAEQDPDDWRRALRELLPELWKQAGCLPEAVVGIGLCAAAHIPVLLDQDDRPVRPAILWHDRRSQEQAEWLNRHHGERLAQVTANQAGCAWTLPQLRWLSEHEPQALAATQSFLTSKDYLLFLLTGERAADPSSAAATLLFDLQRNEWDPELAGLAGLSPAALPAIRPALAVGGRVSPAAAGEFGLPVGTPVQTGMLDSAAELLGAGALAPGDGLVRLGTAGGVMLVGDKAECAGEVLTYPHPLTGLHYRQAATNCCALSLRWLKSCLGDETGTEPSFAQLDELAAAAPAGADGLFFHPYLQGERAPYWEPFLRGSFCGLTLSHGRPALVRAVLEGTAYSLRDCLRVLSSDLPARLALVGGGVKSRVWPQILANILGRPLQTLEWGDSTHGAALAAGVMAGFFAHLPAAKDKCIRTRELIVPQPDHLPIYQAGFKQYELIKKSLTSVYSAL